MVYLSLGGKIVVLLARFVLLVTAFLWMCTKLNNKYLNSVYMILCIAVLPFILYFMSWKLLVQIKGLNWYSAGIDVKLLAILKPFYPESIIKLSGNQENMKLLLKVQIFTKDEVFV